MPHICQGATENRPVIVVAGAAGSGKTTLGTELAKLLQAPLLDLDTMTNSLLDRIDPFLDGPHWNSDGPHSVEIRTGRYEVLMSVALDAVRIGQRPVLVAPFTRELAGGAEWDRLVTGLRPASVQVVHVDGSPELFANRRAARGATRDLYRPVDGPALPPRVPHIRVDAEWATEKQTSHVLQEIGIS